MIKPMKFVDQYIRGDVNAEQVDDFIDRWHEGETGCSLPEYLGLAVDEFAAWIVGSLSLDDLLSPRKERNG